MKRLLVGLALTVLLGLPAAEAQVGPSVYTPLATCAVFNGPLTAGTTAYLLVRGSCNVPSTANAVALVAVASSPAAAGSFKIWESSLPEPSLAVFEFRGGGGSESTLAIVRLCYPVEECAGEDMALKSSVDAGAALRVVGYFEVLQP